MFIKSIHNVISFLKAVEIKCPEEIHKSIDSRMMSTSVSWIRPVAIGGEGLVKVISNHSPGDQFAVGSTLVV